MKINLVFDDWQSGGKSLIGTEKDIELSKGDFHSGSTWQGEIALTEDQINEIEDAMAAGYTPVFRVFLR